MNTMTKVFAQKTNKYYRKTPNFFFVAVEIVFAALTVSLIFLKSFSFTSPIEVLGLSSNTFIISATGF